MKIEFPDFKLARILVVGDIMLDRYWHGGTSRISPEAPVPVVKVEQIEERPGGAGNVALNIASLGAFTSLVGLSGDDEAADALTTRLTGAKIDCHFVRDESLATITKLRVISRHQQLIRLDFEDHIDDYAKVSLSETATELLSQHQVLLLSDYAKGAISNPQALIKAAREQNIPVLVDPKGTDFERYRGATLLTPNLNEFEAIVGHCPDDATLVKRAQQLIQQYDLNALLVTRGEQGMSLVQRDAAQEHYFPAQAKEVYDVTGAGDTVIGTLATALAAGSDIVTATALANLAASIVVGKLGTAAINKVELSRATIGDSDMGLGVLNEEQLLLAMQVSQEQGERIVMTNGCFDILHSGHVHYLQQAKTLGDRLIVAVNDDASVSRLKGPGRPVNSVERRMAVLSGLGAVDWVVAFSEDTPERLISQLLPDILVKGGDYEVADVAGGKQVIANGGEVKILDFVDGVSTTGIINAVQKH